MGHLQLLDTLAHHHMLRSILQYAFIIGFSIVFVMRMNMIMYDWLHLMWQGD